jgi:SET and MYND domain-containing protein
MLQSQEKKVTISPRLTKRNISGVRCIAESDRHYSEVRNDPAIIPLILGTQAELFEIIEEARDQAWAVPSKFKLSSHLAKIDKITKAGYAGRRWPDDLEPLPMALKTLAALCERQGHVVDTIKIRAKALAFTKHRKNLHYSEDLIDFVLSLSTFTMYPNHRAFLDRTMPKMKVFQDIFIGHLHALHAILRKFYGEQGNVTGIINDFMQVETALYYGPRPGTRAFRRKFKASQETILKWAGVDVKLWTVE